MREIYYERVLSLFDGFSCARMALDCAQIKVGKYYSSEIDKYATQISKALYPDIVRLGDITKWQSWNIDWNIDLLVFGAPCQSYSLAGKRGGIRDPRGALIYNVFDIIRRCKPKRLLMENVVGLLSSGKGKDFEMILKELNSLGYAIDYKIINSALVSAQNRNRVYIMGKLIDDCQNLDFKASLENSPQMQLIDCDELTQVIKFDSKITQPKDKRIVLADILEFGVVDRDKSYCIDANYFKGGSLKQYFEKSRRQLVFEDVRCGEMRGRYLVDGKRQDGKMKTAGLTTQRLEIRKDEKTNTLTTVQKDNYVVVQQRARVNDKGFEKIMDKRPTLTSNSFQHNVKIRTKSKTVRASGRGGFDRHEWDSISDCHYRKLTVRECARLQTIPELIINKMLSCGVSKSRLYSAIGNGFTIDVIAHIFKGLTHHQAQ